MRIDGSVWLNLAFHGVEVEVEVEVVQFRLGQGGAVGAEQPLVVPVPLVRAVERLLERLAGLDRLLPCLVLDHLAELQHLAVLPGPQHLEGGGVFLLDGREQLAAERAYLLAELAGLGHQRPEADQRQRLVKPADHRGDVDTGRGGPGQHGRVDRRLEQRELAEYPLDGQAVADLEQPVGDGVPVGQQGVVARHAEVQRRADGGHRAARGGAGRRGL